MKCPDRLGLLYRITRTLSAAGLDIASARIATEIDQAYDTFYVHDRTGRKLVEPDATDGSANAGVGADAAALRCSADYRATVRYWSDPVGRVLFRLRLRPNHLTAHRAGGELLRGRGLHRRAPARRRGCCWRWPGSAIFLDGSLARASGQVTAFGAFLDSVIDRYSDLVVLLGIVVFFARTPNARGALVAMAGLVGSVMVSYTKARAAIDWHRV